MSKKYDDVFKDSDSSSDDSDPGTKRVPAEIDTTFAKYLKNTLNAVKNDSRCRNGLKEDFPP